MRRKLILITMLALASVLAHAQGFVSNLSVGFGVEGVFPASTINHSVSTYYATGERTSLSVGYVGDARYEFGRHSAIEASYTFNRSTANYYNLNTGAATFVQSDNHEMLGNYVYRLPSTENFKPFFLVGGGLVRFQPDSMQYSTGDTPSAETKAAFSYGFGSDFRVSDHWGLRIQYRGLLRGEPTFKLTSTTGGTNFGTNLKSHVAEPSVQLVYHF